VKTHGEYFSVFVLFANIRIGIELVQMHVLLFLSHFFPPSLPPSLPYLRNDRAILNFSMSPPGQRVISYFLPEERLNPIFGMREVPVIRTHVAVYKKMGGREDKNGAVSEFCLTTKNRDLCAFESFLSRSYLAACRHTSTRRRSSAKRFASSGIAITCRAQYDCGPVPI